MVVIAIHGKRHSGKGTVTRYLLRRFGGSEVAFAAPIKTHLSNIFRVPIDLFLDPELKDVPHKALYGHTPRFCMTSFGTDWGTSMIDRDIWVDQADAALKRLQALGCRLAVVSDLRLPPELDLLKGYDPLLLLHVERLSGLPEPSAANEHKSEETLPLEGFVTVRNGGATKDLKDLFIQVNKALVDSGVSSLIQVGGSSA